MINRACSIDQYSDIAKNSYTDLGGDLCKG